MAAPEYTPLVAGSWCASSCCALRGQTYVFVLWERLDILPHEAQKIRTMIE